MPGINAASRQLAEHTYGTHGQEVVRFESVEIPEEVVEVSGHCETDLHALAVHGRDDLDVTWTTTPRGFMLGTFRDLYGQECTIQESSSAEYTAIWFGVGGCRMHLTLEQVRGLVGMLQTWVESDQPLGPAAVSARGAVERRASLEPAPDGCVVGTGPV